MNASKQMGKRGKRKTADNRRRNLSQEETAEDSKITQTERSGANHFRSRTVMESTMLGATGSQEPSVIQPSYLEQDIDYQYDTLQRKLSMKQGVTENMCQ